MECVLVSAESLIQIWLGRHGEYDHVPFTLKLLNQALPAHQSSLIIIGADEKQAPARGGVRVDRDDRNASVNRTVNSVFHCIRIGNRDKNACGPLLDGPEQFVTFGGGIIRVRSGEGVADAQLLSRLRESSPSTLPIRNLDVGRNQVIPFVGLVSCLSRASNQRDRYRVDRQGTEVRHAGLSLKVA